MWNYNPPINFRTFFFGQNMSDGTNLEGGYQTISVIWFDKSHLSFLRQEKKTLLFQVLIAGIQSQFNRIL